MNFNAWVAEEIPRSADRVAALDDRVTLLRTDCLQVIPGTDSGKAGANYKYIDVLDGYAGHWRFTPMAA